MKRKFFGLLIFSVVAIVTLYALQWLIDSCYNHMSKHKYNLILQHKTDSAIMVFGSSVAHVDIDPGIIRRNTGLSCYNEGWEGVYFVQYRGFINEYLSYQKNCKCIVIACDFDNLGKNEFISRPDLFISHLWNNNVYESLHDIEPQKMFLARFIPGYRLTLYNAGFYKLFISKAHVTNNDNGYEPQKENEKFTTTQLKPFSGEYEEFIYKKFISTINYITSKGIKVILVSTPVYFEGYKFINNADTLKNKYKILEKDNNNIRYLDYTMDGMCLDNSYFSNYSHLNLKGTTLFSEKLSKDIMAYLNKSNN